jgi:phage terminase large subunit-like protein
VRLSCPPRVASAPPRAETLGPLAVELAGEAGLELDDWQAWALEESLGVRANGRWSAFENGICLPRQDGKGGIVEARILAGLFLLDERLLTYTAHEFKTAQEHFLRVRDRVESLPPRYRRRVKQIREAHGSEGVELHGGARLRFLARSGGSGRGFSGDVVFLDEAMILWAAALGALFPTMAARANVTTGGPQLWYLGSAGLGDERSEVFARVRDRGIAGAERLFYAEWSGGEPDDHAGTSVDFDDREEWYRANPAMHGLSPRITEEFVENERGALPDDEFARERLCIWGAASGQAVIDPDVWRALLDAKSKLSGKTALAVDVPPEGKRATIARAGERADGRVHGEVDSRPGTTWAVERLAELSKKRNAPVVLDGGSRAVSLVPALVAAGVKPIVYGTRQVVGACGEFMDKVDEDRLRHVGQPELNFAVDAARKRKVGDAWAWHRRDASVDISPLVALTLAVRGLSEEPPRRRTGRAMAV